MILVGFNQAMNIIEEEASKKVGRPEQLTAQYFGAIDNHINDLATGRCSEVMTLKAVAELLFVHPGHLSNVVKVVTGHSTCYHFECRLADQQYCAN